MRWISVEESLARRVADLASAPSLAARAVLHNSHIASLAMCKLRVAPPTASFALRVDRAGQRLTKVAWQALLVRFMMRHETVGFPCEVPSWARPGSPLLPAAPACYRWNWNSSAASQARG